MATQSALHDEEEHAWQARKNELKHLQDRFLAIGVCLTT
jgi:hypothetical protein